MSHDFMVRGFRMRDGKTTTVALEAEIWDMLEEICKHEKKSLKQIVEEVDAGRDGKNRASALRCYVLRYLREKAYRASRDASVTSGDGRPSMLDDLGSIWLQ